MLRIWTKDSLHRDDSLRVKSGCQTVRTSSDGWTILSSDKATGSRASGRYFVYRTTLGWSESAVRCSGLLEAMSLVERTDAAIRRIAGERRKAEGVGAGAEDAEVDPPWPCLVVRMPFTGGSEPRAEIRIPQLPMAVDTVLAVDLVDDGTRLVFAVEGGERGGRGDGRSWEAVVLGPSLIVFEDGHQVSHDNKAMLVVKAAVHLAREHLQPPVH